MCCSNKPNLRAIYMPLEREDLWTENDRRQLEEEIRSILDQKEKELKEGKQKNLETVHAKKTMRTFSRNT